VFGWLAFVVAAVAIGNAVGTKNINMQDANAGQSRQAGQILSKGFPQADPQTEFVLVQSSARKSLRRVLLARRVALVLAASTIAAGGRGRGTIPTYLPAYLKSGLHLGQITAGVVFTAVMAASVAGPVAAGRLGRTRLLVGAYPGGAAAGQAHSGWPLWVGDRRLRIHHGVRGHGGVIRCRRRPSGL
jgi:hypothetical protein